MRKRFLSLLTVLSVAILVIGFAVPTAYADSKSTETGGEGLYRYVEHEIVTEDGDTTMFTSTMNMTVPETMAENHTLEGTLTVEHENGYTNTTTNYVNVTITNESGSPQETFTKSVELGENGTADFTLDTDFPAKENCTILVEYSHNKTSLTASETFDVTVVDNTQYQLSVVTPSIILQIIPIFVIIAVLIPVIKTLMGDIGESATDATGGKY